ncbi:MAG TPA: hypothetical protein VK750_10870 [Cytophagaceae bacterium]|jgi:protein CpxP|nr:hypothetical protein [Cytophagaceae bacterium]
MKKTFILSIGILSLCFVSLTSRAQRGQENNTPESKANKVAQHLQSKLGLTDDQKNKLYDLNMTTIKSTRTLKIEKRNDVSGLKEGFSSIHKEYDKGIKSILTPEQYTAYKQIQTDARAREQKEKQEQAGGKKIKFNADEEDPEEEMTWEESD